MATIIINAMGSYTFGMMTNRLVSGLIAANTALPRVTEAIATASAGHSGVEGTQFEIPSTGAVGGTPPNLFGVVASATPGEQGASYRYAVEQLATAWATFWAAAEDYVKALDNGQTSV